MNGRAEPTTESDVVAELEKDTIVRVRQAIPGQRVFYHNDLWLETNLGMSTHPLSSRCGTTATGSAPQPGRRHVAEVIVPWTDAYWIRPTPTRSGSSRAVLWRYLQG